MARHLLFILYITFFLACSNEKEQATRLNLSKKDVLSKSITRISKPNTDTISTNNKVFKNLKFFNVDSLPPRDSLLPLEIDKEVYKKLFGKNVISNPEPLMGDFLLSRQSRSNGLKEEVILTGDKFYMTLIVYVIYDKNNKLMTTFELARSGGDMGYFEIAYGYFENDTIYHKTKIVGTPHLNTLTKEPDLTKPAIIDTTNNVFLISKSGIVKKIS